MSPPFAFELRRLRYASLSYVYMKHLSISQSCKRSSILQFYIISCIAPASLNSPPFSKHPVLSMFFLLCALQNTLANACSPAKMQPTAASCGASSRCFTIKTSVSGTLPPVDQFIPQAVQFLAKAIFRAAPLPSIETGCRPQASPARPIASSGLTPLPALHIPAIPHSLDRSRCFRHP